MNNFKYILFDLDGTLTDPAEGITNSVTYALNKFGISVNNRKTLYPFIGPPLTDSFKSIYGFSEEKAALAVKYYREYFTPKGIFENNLISGIPELLSKLFSGNKTIILATSKPLIFAETILKHFNLQKYFYKVYGSNLDGTLTDKADIIKKILDECNIPKENAIMVGDRKYDIIGAKKNNIAAAGVLFGYGSKKELLDCNADFLFSTPKELLTILL